MISVHVPLFALLMPSRDRSCTGSKARNSLQAPKQVPGQLIGQSIRHQRKCWCR